jgi:hypothetical protein
MRRMAEIKNIFWIGATMTFDLQSGATNQILTFVHREEDASTFTSTDASAYHAFVKVRAERYSKDIIWSIDPSTSVPGRWVIKGVQDVI